VANASNAACTSWATRCLSAEAGCTAHEIGAITGHSSLAELVRYTKAADQRRLAEAAMVKTRTFVRKPAARFAKKAGKAFEIKGQKR